MLTWVLRRSLHLPVGTITSSLATLFLPTPLLLFSLPRHVDAPPVLFSRATLLLTHCSNLTSKCLCEQTEPSTSSIAPIPAPLCITGDPRPPMHAHSARARPGEGRDAPHSLIPLTPRPVKPSPLTPSPHTAGAP